MIRVQGLRSATIVLCGFCLAAAGCHAPAPQTGLRGDLAATGTSTDTPGWVTTGQGTDKGTIYGVGSCSRLRSDDLARKTARVRAREAITQTLVEQTRQVLSTYAAASGVALDLDAIGAQIAKVDLTGATDEATWLSPAGEYFLLVGIAGSDVKAQIAAMTALTGDVRRVLAERLDKQISQLHDRNEATSSGGGGLHY